MARTLMMTLAVVLAASVVLAQPPAPRVDPCSLLTKADIKEAAGVESSAGTPNKNNAAVCDYALGSGGVLGVSVPPGGPGATADRIAAELSKRGIKTEDAPGIGDRAFYAAMGYGMLQLNAFKGGRYVIITLMLPGANEAKSKDAASKLMNKALGKL